MSYKLSLEAQDDLEQIYRRGIVEFGEHQADKYYDALFDRFEELAEYPYHYPAVDHIIKGLRKSVCGKNTVYYEITDSGVFILFILGRQDIRLRLKQWQR